MCIINKGFWDDEGYYFNRQGLDKHGGSYNDNWEYIPGEGWNQSKNCYESEIDNNCLEEDDEFFDDYNDDELDDDDVPYDNKYEEYDDNDELYNNNKNNKLDNLNDSKSNNNNNKLNSNINNKSNEKKEEAPKKGKLSTLFN